MGATFGGCVNVLVLIGALMAFTFPAWIGNKDLVNNVEVGHGVLTGWYQLDSSLISGDTGSFYDLISIIDVTQLDNSEVDDQTWIPILIAAVVCIGAGAINLVVGCCGFWRLNFVCLAVMFICGFVAVVSAPFTDFATVAKDNCEEPLCEAGILSYEVIGSLTIYAAWYSYLSCILMMLVAAAGLLNIRMMDN